MKEKPKHPFRRLSDIGAVDEDFKRDPKETVRDAFWTTAVLAVAGIMSLYLVTVATRNDLPGQNH